MSQDFNDPELFADFIVEAREHLETIEPNLLELEKAPDNLALLNEIFRPMHSMKGASGFLGLGRINGLAHRAENIMDELRKGAMTVTSEIMDVILAATDALRQMIDNLEKSGGEGDVATEPIIAQIDAIMAGQGAGGAAPASKPAAPKAAPAPAPKPEPKPEPAPAPEPEAAPKAAPAAASMSSEDWINAQKNLAPYALTGFGEGHLRDFIDESRELTEHLSSELMDLESSTETGGDLVNDLFRYFHNLKGNSGIISYIQVNEVTHEAETLLNFVRRGEMKATRELIDLLLFVVDVIEALVNRIDPVAGTTRPFNIDEVLSSLRRAVAGEAFSLPQGLAPVAAPGPAAEGQTAPADSGPDNNDVILFSHTVRQQMRIIETALKELSADSAKRDQIDALFRSLVTIQNSSRYMSLEEIRVYAERTAGIVDKGRSTDMDFGLMVDLLEQECGIIGDMLEAAITRLGGPEKNAPLQYSMPEQGEAKAASQVAPQAPSQTGGQPAGKAAAPAAAKPAEAPAAKPAEPATPPSVKEAAPLAKPAPVPAAKPAAAPAAAAATGAGGAAAGGGEASKASSTIRVDHEKLDHLMNLIGELLINRNRYSMLARTLESGVNVDIAEVAQNLSETTYAMARISDDLQDTIMKVRMVPVSSVFSRFPRLVRDLSRKSGKDVDLVLEGEETELDKSVVEVIGDPLVHLIRNSVDHGVEEEAVRLAAGKPAKGRVVLRAYHKGNVVAIEIEDDGKGIDPEKMREVAVRKGILSADEARALDDREARELIFAPGFSSAEVITDISGRGVGMDVVRTNIKNLKGSVSISSEVGKGTRFTLSLPLTLAIIDALMIKVAGAMFAIPLDAVSETTKIEAHRLTDVKGRKAVTLRGEVLGIVNLSDLLALPPSPPVDMLSVVVIHDNERRLGIVVDTLLERQEIVIKPLGAYLGDLKGLSGATIMGDGSVILILDPHEIYMMATSKAIS